MPTSAAPSPPTPGWSPPRCSPRRSPPRSGASSPTCSARSCWSRSRWSSSCVGSAVAGLSQNIGHAHRAAGCVQGLGVGGLTALAQVIMAAMISPRERGRYSGYLGATFAAGHGRRPADRRRHHRHRLARLALVLLRRRAVRRRRAHRAAEDPAPARRRSATCTIDYLGAFLSPPASRSLLIWVSLAGNKYAWCSWQTYAMVGGALALLAALRAASSRTAREPIIPLRLFRNRTIALSVAGQPVRRRRACSAAPSSSASTSSWPAASRRPWPACMTIPMIARAVPLLHRLRPGHHPDRDAGRRWLLAGGVLLTAGLGLLGTIALRHQLLGTGRRLHGCWSAPASA